MKITEFGEKLGQLPLKLNGIEKNHFFLHKVLKEWVNKIELSYKMKTQQDWKMGVNRLKFPYHLQVWECPPWVHPPFQEKKALTPYPSSKKTKKTHFNPPKFSQPPDIY